MWFWRKRQSQGKSGGDNSLLVFFRWFWATWKAGIEGEPGLSD